MPIPTVTHGTFTIERVFKSAPARVFDAFAGQPISSSLATMEFLADGTGTRLVFTEQAAFFPGGDGIEIREAGTRELLGQLAAELGE